VNQISDFPLAPFDSVMPAAGQTALLWAVGILLTASALAAIRECLRNHSAIPLLLVVAGVLTVALDPFVAHLGHAIHPPVGQWMLFKALDRATPIHIMLLYGVYYGAVYLLLFSRIRSGAFSASFVWKLFGVFSVLAYVMEIGPLNLGLWTYYDPQALWVWKGGMPLFHLVLNGASLFLPLTLIKLCYPVLKGWKQILVVPLSPVGAIMGHVGCGFPFYLAANSSANQLVVDLAGLLSIAFALGLIYVCSRLLSARTDHLLVAETPVNLVPGAVTS
jgi:hypothetical protein